VSLDAEITALSRRRQDLWSEGGQAIEVAKLTRRLADLYELKRQSHATTTDRAEVIKRARVESELERLISR
jgi:hypothetical protein